MCLTNHRIFKTISIFFNTFLVLSASARATVLVNPPAPLEQHNMGDTFSTIYLGGSSTGTPALFSYYNSTLGYRFIQTNSNDPQDIVWLDVSTNSNIAAESGKRLVVTLSTGSSLGTEIPLTGAGIVTSNTAPPSCALGGCQGNGGYYSAIYQKGTVLRVSFSISALCAAQGSGSLCAGNAPSTLVGATLSQSIVVTFGNALETATGPVGASSTSGGTTDSSTVTLTLSDMPPVLSCPGGTISDYYFPGDRSVYINPTNYGQSTGVDGVELKSILVLANRSGVNGFTGDAIPANEVIAYLDINGGTQAVVGFENTTNGNDNKYDVRLFAQNKIGILSAQPGGSCDVVAPFQFQAQSIQGVLTESKCFIATAAYHDGRAAPVMMLRKFRDRVLAKSSWGKQFIQTYYRYSPALAEWAWDKPLVRSFALRLLAPIEFVAWAILKLSHAEEPSPQPYIDRLKSRLEKEEPKTESSDGYTDRIKKTLEAPVTSANPQPYIDQLKSRIETTESSEGYTEKERAKLPSDKERLSPIELVKQGKDRNPEPERPTITQALGFTVGVGPGIKVTNTAGGIGFDQVYGSDWQPELMVHYERQIFHSENFGSLGFGVDGGVAFANGYGKLSYAFNGSDTSQTKFTFYQFPLLLSSYYRFNLLRFLRPYVGGSVGSIFYIEGRNDAVKDNRGYDFVFASHVGASLLLDFFDRSTANDGYLSTGIQHSYLFAEFLYLNSFNQTGVVLERSGIYSGFLFEI